MKTAVSISIGSSKRNKKYPLHILGQDVSIERVGTDGDMDKAAQLFHEMDGKVDAFGVGGADLGFLIGEKFYRMHSVTKLTRGVKTTPVVDGNGLKATLEYKVRPLLEKELAEKLPKNGFFSQLGSTVGDLSRAFLDLGYECVFGDLMFGLGLPIPLRTEKSLRRMVRILLPVVSHFPFSWLYPIGSEQEKHTPKWGELFRLGISHRRRLPLYHPIYAPPFGWKSGHHQHHHPGRCGAFQICRRPNAGNHHPRTGWSFIWDKYDGGRHRCCYRAERTSGLFQFLGLHRIPCQIGGSNPAEPPGTGIEPMNVLITAGGIPSAEDSLFEATRGGYKALIPLAGKPIIQWIVDAVSTLQGLKIL